MFLDFVGDFMFIHDVSIFNKYFEDNKPIFKKAVLNGVLFVKDENTIRNKLGLDNSDSVKVYIPKFVKSNKKYINSFEFDSLSIEMLDEYYTIAKGDFISFGDIGQDNLYINELKNYTGNIYEITGIEDYNFGSLQSIVVSAK